MMPRQQKWLGDKITTISVNVSTLNELRKLKAELNATSIDEVICIKVLGKNR